MRTKTMHWVIAPAFALLCASAAHAHDGGWRHKLAGEWNNAATGENMKIQGGEIGWEAWLSNVGEARISAESDAGSNIKVEARGMTCEYYLTMVNDNLINMQLRDGPDTCLKGAFARVHGITVKHEHEHEAAHGHHEHKAAHEHHEHKAAHEHKHGDRWAHRRHHCGCK